MTPSYLLAFDLDGTVGTSLGVPQENVEILQLLATLPILRVAVTGRSLHSFLHSQYVSLALDAVIFSSGLGIFIPESRQVISTRQLSKEQIRAISALLIERRVDFSLHFSVPDNHKFWVYRTGADNPDMDSRCVHNSEFFPWQENLPDSASQFLVVLPPSKIFLFEELKASLVGVSVIRATSPIDGKSLWLEIFPSTVCKSSGVAALAHQYGLSSQQILAVGNDYNDVDLLRWAGERAVVADSAAELLAEFPVTASCADGGFAKAVRVWVKKIGLEFC